MRTLTEHEAFRGALPFLAVAVLLFIGIQLLREGGALREAIQRGSDPQRARLAYGSAHFCTPGEFSHLQKAKGPHELCLRGAFYTYLQGPDGRNHLSRLERGFGRDNSRPFIAFSAEDQARGMAFIGPPGSGKSQAGILPIAADAMKGGQSLIALDPQGELTAYFLDFARVTGHRVIIHDPTDPTGPRFNLAGGITGVSDAGAIAHVILGGVDDFWERSARNLLAGCLLRFDSLGEMVRAFDDLEKLASILLSQDDGAANLTRSFAASISAGDRSAPGILATLTASRTLSAWADPAVQAATATSDFSAEMLIEHPTLILLRCPGRAMEAFGPYLGAVLERLLLDLDTLAQAGEGALTRPVKIVIDEFPMMGRLDAVLQAVNLFRKRQISFVIAAQTLAQLALIYGKDGMEALLSGMATQVYFGACDAYTAGFVSRMLGRTTEKRRDGEEVKESGRDLLGLAEIISPHQGSCTLLHRWATPSYAAQVVLLARLTPFYQRKDWERAIAEAADREVWLVERGLFDPANEKDTGLIGERRINRIDGGY